MFDGFYADEKGEFMSNGHYSDYEEFNSRDDIDSFLTQFNFDVDNNQLFPPDLYEKTREYISISPSMLTCYGSFWQHTRQIPLNNAPICF